MESEPIYHIAIDVEWHQAKGTGAYLPESIEKEGFIHCSTESQTVRTANTFFKGNQNLLLLKIDPVLLNSTLKYEKAVDLDESFPHIYGPLNSDAVIDEVKFKPAENGEFSFPQF